MTEKIEKDKKEKEEGAGEICARCLQPQSADIHGPIDGCTEDGTQLKCTEPKAHHKFKYF